MLAGALGAAVLLGGLALWLFGPEAADGARRRR